MDTIYSCKVRRGGVDKLYWNPSRRKKFEVKTYYKMPKVPTKVAFFLWTAALGRILTVDNLRKRLLTVVE